MEAQQPPATPGHAPDMTLIEQHKENILPLASGRRAGHLTSLFSTPGSQLKHRLSQERDAHELAVTSPTATLDDWVKYVRWARDSYPTGDTADSNLVLLLERLTRNFKSDEIVKEDVRYVRIWIYYASLVHHPTDIYAFLFSNKIGTSWAVLYSEYSDLLQSHQRLNAARRVLKAGIRANATPVNRLHEALAALPQRTEQDPPAPPRGGILGRAQMSASTSNGATAKISVLSTSHRGGNTDQDSDNPWTLGTRDERRKEDMILKTTWSGQVIKQGATTPARAAEALGEKISIFKDETSVTPAKSAISDDQFFKSAPAQSEGELLLSNPLMHWFSSSSEIPDLPEFLEEDIAPIAQNTKVKLKTHAQSSTSVNDASQASTSSAATSSQIETKVIQDLLLEMYPEGSQGRFVSIDEIRLGRMGLLNKDWPTPVKANRIAVPVRPPSPTVNTKAAMDDVLGFFNMTVHGLGANQPIHESNSDSDSSDDSIDGGMTNPSAHSLIPPTPTPMASRPQSSPLIFRDENISQGPPPPPTPQNGLQYANENQQGQKPFQLGVRTPLRTPLCTKKIPVFSDAQSEVIAESVEESEQTPPIQGSDERAIGDGSEHAAKELGMQNALSESSKLEEEATNFAESLSQSNFDVETSKRRLLSDNLPAPLTADGQESIHTSSDYVLEAQEYEDVMPSTVPARARMSRFPTFDPLTPITERTMEFSSRRESNTYDSEDLTNSNNTSLLYLSGPAIEEPDSRESPVSQSFGLSEGYTIDGYTGRDMAKFAQGETSSPSVQDVSIAHNQDNVQDAPVNTELVEDINIATQALHLSSDPPIVPNDEKVIESLLSKVDFSSIRYEGYHDLRPAHSENLSSLQSTAKVRSRRSTGSGRINASKDGEGWNLNLGSSSFEVVGKIGQGGFGAVFAVKAAKASHLENISLDLDNFDPENFEDSSEETQALKIESPPNLWEFHVLRNVASRIPERICSSIINAKGCHLYTDESYLFMKYSPYGTLLDLVNHGAAWKACPEGAKGIDLTLVVFYTIELLRIMESLHSAGFIHSDLKIDNCMLRFDDDFGNIGTSYLQSGEEGWNSVGIRLIDFGRAIDTKDFPSGQKFVGDWDTDSNDCPELRLKRPWTYETDYYGVAGIIHCMLFGDYISTIEFDDEDGNKRHKFKQGLKRYWTADLNLAELLDLLLNPAKYSGHSSLPLNSQLKEMREQMEAWLHLNCKKVGKELTKNLKAIRREAQVHMV